MPPPVSVIAPPRGRRDALAFLESKGIVAHTPTIRSRDFSLVNTCRFLFYLTRRLALASPFTSSDALRRGSWFHTRLEAIGLEGARLASFMASKLAAREQELRDTCKLLELSQESTATIVASEKEDCLTAWAWFDAAAQFRRADIPELRHGFVSYLNALPMRLLGKELRLCLKHTYTTNRRTYPVTLVAQLDELRYNVETNVLWIVDAKSTASVPIERAATFPCEFQPRHFSFILSRLLADNIVQRHFNLPANVRFGGFIHIVVQKPSIRMGQKDRPYHLESRGLRKKMKGRAVPVSGGGWACVANDIDEPAWPTTTPYTAPNEADAEKWLQEACGKLPDKVYSGEPSMPRYRSRCIDWYNGAGEYEADRPKRESTECPVNISILPADSLLDEDNVEEYLTQLRRVCEYAFMPPEPVNFDRTSAGMEHPEFAPFYTAPPALWPELIRQKNLIQAPWDEDLATSPLQSHAILERTR